MSFLLNGMKEFAFMLYMSCPNLKSVIPKEDWLLSVCVFVSVFLCAVVWVLG